MSQPTNPLIVRRYFRAAQSRGTKGKGSHPLPPRAAQARGTKGKGRTPSPLALKNLQFRNRSQKRQFAL